MRYQFVFSVITPEWGEAGHLWHSVDGEMQELWITLTALGGNAWAMRMQRHEPAPSAKHVFATRVPGDFPPEQCEDVMLQVAAKAAGMCYQQDGRSSWTAADSRKLLAVARKASEDITEKGYTGVVTTSFCRWYMSDSTAPEVACAEWARSHGYYLARE